MMAGYTVLQKQEQIRTLILRVLMQEKNATARQLSNELSIYDIWLSPDKIANLMRSDPRLKAAVSTEYIRRYRWAGLVYTHIRNGGARR